MAGGQIQPSLQCCKQCFLGTQPPPPFSTLSVAASPWNAGEGRCDSPPYSQPSLPALVWTCIRKAVLWEEKERGAFSLETRPLL